MGKSSKDKRDAYYRLAKEQNWRARSAFKLIQLDEQFDLFSYENPEQCTRVVDLCAAPGSWSQVLSRVLIKGESFGRRRWVEKMEKYEADCEKRRQLNSTSTDDSMPVPVPVNEMAELTVSSQDLGIDSTDPVSNTTQQAQVQQPTTDADVNNELEIDTDTTKPKLLPRPNVKIVAIDLQPMSPLPGITQLKADITHPSTIPLLLSALDISPTSSQSTSPTTSLVDLVISDGAPDVTGLHDLDIYIQSSLLHAALSLAIKVLRPGGKFVAKIFRGRNCDVIYAQLKLCFERVTVAKPRSSRASSVEAFVVCEGFNGVRLDELEVGMGGVEEDEDGDQEVDGGFNVGVPKRIKREDGVTVLEFPERERAARWIAPFLACGDLDAYDADATYKLPADHVSLPPVQPPTAPPYKEAIERRRVEGGMYGKTKNRNVGDHNNQ